MTRSISDIDRRIAGRIREFRKAAGLSMADLAGPLGVSVQQVQKVETGSNRISAGQLQRIAEVIGCPVARLHDEPGDLPVRLPTVREAQEALHAAALVLADAQARASAAVALAEAA